MNHLVKLVLCMNRVFNESFLVNIAAFWMYLYHHVHI